MYPTAGGGWRFPMPVRYRTLAQQQAIYDVRPTFTTTKETTTMTIADDELAHVRRAIDQAGIDIDGVTRKIRKQEHKRTLLNRERYQLVQRETELRKRLRPEPKASLITFNKKFAGNSVNYTYAAHRSGDFWYVTGQTGPNGVIWESLVRFIEKDNTLPFNYTEQVPTNYVTERR